MYSYILNDRNVGSCKRWVLLSSFDVLCLVLQCIPQHFAKYHPDLNLKTMMLENASGGKWAVLVQPHGKVLCFSKGWRAFSRENNLCIGDHLIFTHIEELHFKVTAYDSHGKSLRQLSNAHEALDPTARAHDRTCEALAEPPCVKTEAMQPLTFAVKQEYPLPQPDDSGSNLAKRNFHHILPPAYTRQVSDPHISAAATEVPQVSIPAPTVDCTR